MRTRLILFIFFLAIIPGLQAQNPGISYLVSSVNIDSLKSYVRILAGDDAVQLGSQSYTILSRKPGTTTHPYAGDYIRLKFSQYGLTNYEQLFTTSVSGRNIYAVQPGSDNTGMYIICAHYDAVRNYAADDNATGTAAVIEAARLLSGITPQYTVVYALWDQEETGLNGSKYYAGLASAEGKNIKGVINLDMLGWDSNSDGKAEIHTRDYSVSPAMASTLAQLNTNYQIGLNTTIYNPGATASDHASFWTYNYPAILLIEAYKGGDFNPYYHTVSDRSATLNLSYYLKMAKLSIAGLSNYVATNTAPQDVHLTAGWNILSFSSAPAKRDIKSILQQKINDGSLVRVLDETGNSLENLGTLGGWVNHIGNMALTEGYKIKVNSDCTVSLFGNVTSWPMEIPLTAGWNIMGYPRQSEADAMEVVQQLIDRNTLVKVQDETGNSIENFGAGGGWTNNIGNFKPGKGYKIKVNATETLTINQTYSKSALMLRPVLPTTHFHSAVSGNGVDHMNINMMDIPAGLLEKGDEIAVFDGAICVGMVVIGNRLPVIGNQFNGNKSEISNPKSEILNISIPVSASDHYGQTGFTEGNLFTLKIWKAKTKTEFPLVPEILKGTPYFIKNESAMARLVNPVTTGFSEMEKLSNDPWFIYPNPTYGKVQILWGGNNFNGVHISLMDARGRRLMERGMVSNPEIIDLSGNVSGIYFIRITGDHRSGMEKIILR